MIDTDNMSKKEIKAILKSNKSKKSGDYSKSLVKIIFILTIIFTIVVLYIHLKTGSEPSTLVEYWYKCMVGELGIMGGIKVVKTWKGDK